MNEPITQEQMAIDKEFILKDFKPPDLDRANRYGAESIALKYIAEVERLRDENQLLKNFKALNEMLNEGVEKDFATLNQALSRANALYGAQADENDAMGKRLLLEIKDLKASLAQSEAAALEMRKVLQRYSYRSDISHEPGIVDAPSSCAGTSILKELEAARKVVEAVRMDQIGVARLLAESMPLNSPSGEGATKEGSI